MDDKSTTPAGVPEQDDASQAAPGASTDGDQASTVTTTAAEPEASATPDAVDSSASSPRVAATSGNGASVSSVPPRRLIDTQVREFTRADLTRAEQVLLDELAAGQRVQLLIPTATKLDTGNWLMRGKLWVACTEDRLLLFAAGRRPLREAAPFAQLRESLYNHVTGQLVLAPAPRTQVRGLRLATSAASSLLSRFKTKSAGND